jgi:5-methylcytosine-specific restriction endonuclease McrA
MRTLVLNAGYEPLSVVSFKRAVVLVLAGKATVLVDSDVAVRSPGSLHRPGVCLRAPSVILLQRYVRTQRRRSVLVSRRGVLRRDGHRCGYCQAAASTIDHILPRSRGGTDSWENLTACCLRCNGAKGNRTPEEMGWRLVARPQAPMGPAWALRGVDTWDPSWSEFLPVAA